MKVALWFIWMKAASTCELCKPLYKEYFDANSLLKQKKISFFIMEMKIPARNRHSTTVIRQTKLARLFTRLCRQSAIFLLAQKIIRKYHSCWIVVLGEEGKKEWKYNRKKQTKIHRILFCTALCFALFVSSCNLIKALTFFSGRNKSSLYASCSVFVWFFASWIKWIKHIHTHYDCTPVYLSTVELMYKLIFGMAVDETLKLFAECRCFFHLRPEQRKCSTQVRVCVLHLFTRTAHRLLVNFVLLFRTVFRRVLFFFAAFRIQLLLPWLFPPNFALFLFMPFNSFQWHT